jgi:F420-non-reducing hydrogenase iron-sulfur subunit
MCTGRVDLEFILRAFSNGMDGVFIGGCWPGECHYITEGNYYALVFLHLTKKILEQIGVNPERLRLAWISAAEGTRFAEVMNEFAHQVKILGPLGKTEGIDDSTLKFRLQTIRSLVPYIKLVERERLRVRFDTEEEYQAFFASKEFNGLYQELIGDKLEVTQMMALLREKPRSVSEISNILDLSPSKISRHLNGSARQGLGSFDERQNLIGAAYGGGEDGGNKVRSAALDNAKIEQIIDKHKGKAGSLIHVLMEIQEENDWLPVEVLQKISSTLQVPLSRVMQIATFYKTFSLTPKGRHEVHVCTGTSCHVRGAGKLLDAVHDLIGIGAGETDGDAKFSLAKGSCQGCCTLGPEMIVDGKHHPRVKPAKVEDVLKNYD